MIIIIIITGITVKLVLSMKSGNGVNLHAFDKFMLNTSSDHRWSLGEKKHTWAELIFQLHDLALVWIIQALTVSKLAHYYTVCCNIQRCLQLQLSQQLDISTTKDDIVMPWFLKTDCLYLMTLPVASEFTHAEKVFGKFWWQFSYCMVKLDGVEEAWCGGGGGHLEGENSMGLMFIELWRCYRLAGGRTIGSGWASEFVSRCGKHYGLDFSMLISDFMLLCRVKSRIDTEFSNTYPRL